MCAQSSKNPRPNVNQHITDKLEVSIMCFSAILFSLDFFSHRIRNICNNEIPCVRKQTCFGWNRYAEFSFYSKFFVSDSNFL